MAPKKVSKTALKFLSLARGRHGTHVSNLKDWYGELVEAGYVDDGYPFAHITEAGRAALAAYVAAGGKLVRIT